MEARREFPGEDKRTWRGRKTGRIKPADPRETSTGFGIGCHISGNGFTVPFLGEEFEVSFPGGEVKSGGGRRLEGPVVVLVLHYLIYRGEPLRDSGWLAYRDMPGARHFASAFEQMAEQRLADHFGATPGWIEAPALELWGEPSAMGDRSFEIPVFPRFSLLVVLWAPSEVAGGSARILFPASAPYYLHTEDLAALGVVLAERLIALDAGRESIGGV